MKIMNVDITSECAGLRLDKALATLIPALSRSRIQQLLSEGRVSLASQTVTDGARKVKPDECYTLSIPEAAPSAIKAQAMELSIAYEDDDLLVINKPAGLTVHPAPGNYDNTLVNALLAHCGESLSGIGGVARPGIVHRLDKDTSGLMVAAKNDAAHKHLSAQLSARTLKRIYLALVHGAPTPGKGTITGNIGRSSKNRQKMAVVSSGGKPATTHYATLQRFDCGKIAFALVECTLETGRTHQIRVHMQHIHHPLVGDPAYGLRAKAGAPETLRHFTRQALHAHQIGFIHPASGEAMRFTAALPHDMQALIDALKNP